MLTLFTAFNNFWIETNFIIERKKKLNFKCILKIKTFFLFIAKKYFLLKVLTIDILRAHTRINIEL